MAWGLPDPTPPPATNPNPGPAPALGSGSQYRQKFDPNAFANFAKGVYGGVANMGNPNSWGAKPRQQAKAQAQQTPSGPPPSPYGTESGPGILESWFKQRAEGTDPAFEYASKRGMTDLANRYSAAGGFNSGAARQGESDFMANLISQREGQLDALAGGASGERQGRLNAMFGQGGALAGGQAGLMGAYDLASANSNNEAMKALMQIYGNKAGVDAAANKQGMGNIIGLGSLFA